MAKPPPHVYAITPEVLAAGVEVVERHLEALDLPFAPPTMVVEALVEACLRECLRVSSASAQDRDETHPNPR